MHVLLKLFFHVLCIGLCQAVHADSLSFFQGRYAEKIEFQGVAPIFTKQDRFYKFFSQSYYVQHTGGVTDTKETCIGFFLPDVVSWKSQFIWLDILPVKSKNSSLRDLEHLANKMPLGIGYRKLLSSTRFMGVYAYSDSLWPNPFDQVHIGAEFVMPGLMALTLNGHYHFPLDEKVFVKKDKCWAEEKWGASLHVSSNYLHFSNVWLLQSCTPYIGIAYTELVKSDHPTYIAETVWDGIIGVRFKIKRNLSFSLESNIVDWKMRNVSFVNSLCVQSRRGAANRFAKWPERYLSNCALKKTMANRLRVHKEANQQSTKNRNLQNKQRFTE